MTLRSLIGFIFNMYRHFSDRWTLTVYFIVLLQILLDWLLFNVLFLNYVNTIN
jgi:hypothetical protein